MSSPPPKEKQKLSQKLSRWLKPSKSVASASAASIHSTPVSSSPSHGLTHAAGHAMETGGTITAEALGTSASGGSQILAGVRRAAHVASSQDGDAAFLGRNQKFEKP